MIRKPSREPVTRSKKTLVVQKLKNRVTASQRKEKADGFDFYFKRTCFRGVVSYYKASYEPCVK